MEREKKIVSYYYDTYRYTVALAFLYTEGKNSDGHPLPAVADHINWLDSCCHLGVHFFTECP
jgi:hypothetical protein